MNSERDYQRQILQVWKIIDSWQAVCNTECVTEKYFPYFSNKTYVVGTQKNRLIETVLLSTSNTC